MAVVETKSSQTANRTINAKQAAKLAFRYFSDLFPETKVADVALEEVEFSEDGNHWFITLGYNDPNRVSKPLIGTNLFGPSYIRQYKVFKVAARTGKVVAMKIRKLE